MSKATAKPRQRAAKHDDDAAAKNRPLVEDIRLLGRILGEVIHEQEGKGAFELVERVRQLSVAYRLKRDAQAGRALDRLLKNLSADQTVSVIRAFSYFSHLANITEDRHHVRRREHHESQGHLQEGSLAPARVRRLSEMRPPRARLSACSLRGLSRRATGGVQLQATRLLRELRCAPDG